MGAGSANHGSGANHLCLNDQAIKISTNVPGIQLNVGTIGSVEYDFGPGFGDNKPFSWANAGGKTLQDQDAVCVLCFVSSASTSVMIPGVQDCPASWNLEYYGVLMSEGDVEGRMRTEYICVDQAPEGRPGYEADGKLGRITVVEMRCGSATCSSHAVGDGVGCAVCST